MPQEFVDNAGRIKEEEIADEVTHSYKPQNLRGAATRVVQHNSAAYNVDPQTWSYKLASLDTDGGVEKWVRHAT